MSNIETLWGREPALIIGAIQAIVGLVVALGIDIDDTLRGAILVAAAAVLSLVVRSRVSPVVDAS